MNKEDKVIFYLYNNSRHLHMYKEYYFYSSIISKSSYYIVHLINQLAHRTYKDRTLDKGNNSKIKIKEWLKKNNNSKFDRDVINKLFKRFTPSSYIRRKF